MKARLIPVFVMLRRIRPAVVVMMRVGVVLHVFMTGMVVVKNVTGRVVLVGVHNGSRVGPNWDSQCHAYGRRKGKQERQRRPKGGAAPASSFPMRQHAFDPGQR